MLFTVTGEQLVLKLISLTLEVVLILTVLVRWPPQVLVPIKIITE